VLVVIAILLALFVLPSPWGLAAIVAAAVLEVAETYFFIRLSQRRRAAVGAEAMVGRAARARTRLAPEGQVEIAGEIWRARSTVPIEAGETVRVRTREGLTLLVEPGD
jgi:membrane-bound serine protease (ClpP class)